MTTAETIMAIIGGLSIAGTGIAWAIKVILAPLKVVSIDYIYVVRFSFAVSVPYKVW